MKTPEEWGAEFYREFCAIHSGHEAFIERIQADARHAALTEAVALCNGVGNDWESQGEVNMSAGAIECAFKLINLRDNHP